MTTYLLMHEWYVEYEASGFTLLSLHANLEEAKEAAREDYLKNFPLRSRGEEDWYSIYTAVDGKFDKAYAITPVTLRGEDVFNGEWRQCEG